jgi:hypothetical protein
MTLRAGKVGSPIRAGATFRTLTTPSSNLSPI